MHTEDLFVNQGCNWQAVEDVGEDFPKSNGVSSLAFVVKSINSIDLSAFVVSSQKEEVLWIFDLVAEKQANTFNGLFSSIDVITKEKVVSLGWEASILENSEEVVVLAMDITYTLILDVKILLLVPQGIAV